jgi:hypothetical protein
MDFLEVTMKAVVIFDDFELMANETARMGLLPPPAEGAPEDAHGHRRVALGSFRNFLPPQHGENHDAGNVGRVGNDEDDSFSPR